LRAEPAGGDIAIGGATLAAEAPHWPDGRVPGQGYRLVAVDPDFPQREAGWISKTRRSPATFRLEESSTSLPRGS